MDNSNKKNLPEVSIGFTSIHCLRFFLRTTCKKRQNDNKRFVQFQEVNLG